MAITDPGDLTGIVEWWSANDVTTTGSVVETMVGQEGVVDLDNPNVYQSDPSLIEDHTAYTDAVDMTGPGNRAKLEGDTGETGTSDYTVGVFFELEDDTEIDWTLLVLDLTSGAHLVVVDEGTVEWEFQYATRLTGPTLSTGDRCVLLMIAQTIAAVTTFTLYWSVNGGALQSTSTVTTPAYAFGNWRFGSNFASHHYLLGAFQCSAVLGATARQDVADYYEEQYSGGGGSPQVVTGGSGLSTDAALGSSGSVANASPQASAGSSGLSTDTALGSGGSVANATPQASAGSSGLSTGAALGSGGSVSPQTAVVSGGSGLSTNAALGSGGSATNASPQASAGSSGLSTDAALGSGGSAANATPQASAGSSGLSTGAALGSGGSVANASEVVARRLRATVEALPVTASGSVSATLRIRATLGVAE